MSDTVHTRKSPSSLPHLPPLSGKPWAQQHLPKGDDEGRFLIKGHGQRTPGCMVPGKGPPEEMGRRWSEVRCLGQKNPLRSLQERGGGRCGRGSQKLRSEAQVFRNSHVRLDSFLDLTASENASSHASPPLA